MSKNFLFEFDNPSQQKVKKGVFDNLDKNVEEKKTNFERELEEFYDSFRYEKYNAYNKPSCDYLRVEDKSMNEDTEFHPTIYDSSIFNINYENIEKRIKVKPIYDSWCYLTIDDFYINPLSVRKFAEKTPVALAKQISPTSYPGYTNAQFADGFVLSELKYIFEQIFKKYFLRCFGLPNEFEDYFQYSNDYFSIQSTFGIFNPTHITYENSIETIHTDGEKTSIFTEQPLAVVIYLNLPSECQGGTALYSQYDHQAEPELIDIIEMKFNRVAIYPTFVLHKHTYDKRHWQHKWRVIQRLFYNLTIQDQDMARKYNEYFVKGSFDLLDESF